MTRSHFADMASRWRLVGPPLRPSEADLRVFRRSLPRKTVRALVLGVTPELYNLGYPKGSKVQALDASSEMAKLVWPGPFESVTIGSWTDPPLAPESFDFVVCDGGVGLLSPGRQRALVSAMARLLAPGGRFVTRLFAPQGRTGRLDEIRVDLLARRVPSLDALKLRLWGALQASAADGVRPRDVVAVIDEISGGAATLAERLGWSSEHLQALDVHRSSDARYHLVDAEQLVVCALETGSFVHEGTQTPEHAWGESCPIVTLLKT